MPTSTQAVIDHHLQAFSEGVDALMDDFTDESVVMTRDATYRGLAEIRRFYTDLIDGLPEGFEEAEETTRSEIDGEIAFLLWHARPWYLFCSDTFVIRDGKITHQTFAAHTAPQ
ncbi:MAG: nuclear transport factor 2 family protein [Actinomycetota bacterium]|nr:nuclear transport factor 2 family protein [Actinomycetota bacterium]